MVLSETQPVAQLRFRLEIVTAGVGQAGLTPSVAIYSYNEAGWWNGATWQGGWIGVAMTEVDSVNLPGLYDYDATNQTNFGPTRGADGYLAQFYDTTIPLVEYRSVMAASVSAPTVDEIWDEALLDHDTLGTMGDTLRRILGTRQQDMRVINSTFHASGKPETGIVLVYDDAADANADTGPAWALATARYDFVAVYDGSARLTSYVSTRTT